MLEAGSWALVVHGGAKTIDEEERPAHRDGCCRAAEAGQRILGRGGSAVDAVEAVIRVLEDDPIFNAGYGSVLNDEDEVEMCSAIMEGAGLNLGGVAAVQGVRNPISVARTVLGEKWTLLAGEGARRFAARKGLELCPPGDMIARKQKAGEAAMAEHDTVGAVALDVHGLLCAGTSTGGLEGQIKGRVGDSPLPGCGLYAENGIGAAAFSGHGEQISRALLAAKAMQVLEDGTAGAAARASIERLERVGGEAGAIVIDRHGRIGIAHNSDHFAIAAVTSGMARPRAGVHRRELEDLIDHG
ncbi:MAG TPA: isoaspartyl peptidase/L-asparaginase family protein [Allosphingosinicella sp.]